MDLWLIRHAAAAPASLGMGDAARPLTPAGARGMRRVGRALRRRGVVFDRLLVSPALRALDTAECLARLVREEIEVAPVLARAPDARLLASLQGERLALVGHEPWLSELCAWLVVGEPARAALFEIGKGTLVHLAGEPRAGAMRLVELSPLGALRR
jgi:phosphohistidine phosphatase